MHTTTTCVQLPRRDRTEHLVDRLLAVLFPGALDEGRRNLIRLIHQARSAGRAGDLDGALTTLAAADRAAAPHDAACWAYTEWRRLMRRRFPLEGLMVYSPSTGRAAVLGCGPDAGTLSVIAVLGLSWEPGRVLSRRCLRGLKPLHAADHKGGAPCQAS